MTVFCYGMIFHRPCSLFLESLSPLFSSQLSISILLFPPLFIPLFTLSPLSPRHTCPSLSILLQPFRLPLFLFPPCPLISQFSFPSPPNFCLSLFLSRHCPLFLPPVLFFPPIPSCTPPIIVSFLSSVLAHTIVSPSLTAFLSLSLSPSRSFLLSVAIVSLCL